MTLTSKTASKSLELSSEIQQTQFRACYCYSFMLIASCCLQGHLERCGDVQQKQQRKDLAAIFYFSIHLIITHDHFSDSRRCCAYFTLGPDFACKKKVQDFSNAYYSSSLKATHRCIWSFFIILLPSSIRQRELRLHVYSF